MGGMGGAWGAILKQFERILKQFGALGHGGGMGGMGVETKFRTRVKKRRLLGR
jgi:hypothetical protein